MPRFFLLVSQQMSMYHHIDYTRINYINGAIILMYISIDEDNIYLNLEILF